MGALNLRRVRGLLLAGALFGTLVGSAVLGFALARVLREPGALRSPAAAADAIADLLMFPVPDVDPALVVDSFLAARSGERVHHAVDIPAPRHARVVAADDGTIERLSTTPLGGISVYQRDSRGRYCFYYAHLDRWAPGLQAGQKVRRGDAVGFVGTSGNAPATAPHLHFAVHEADASCRGAAVDPLPLLRRATR
jgi:murein DD-endopeptidase MepM/ murein hydrolase activator NlpD